MWESEISRPMEQPSNNSIHIEQPCKVQFLEEQL